jgi:hypothetical protein
MGMPAGMGTAKSQQTSSTHKGRLERAFKCVRLAKHLGELPEQAEGEAEETIQQ